MLQLFGLWFRLKATEQQVSNISELLLPLLREERATAEPEYPPSGWPNSAVSVSAELKV